MPHDENAPVKNSSRLRQALVACVICLAVFQFSENTADPDLWGHVNFGGHWLQTGHLARTDDYSWTASGHAWFNHEILAEAALALAFRAAGGTGLLLLKMATGLAAFFIALGIAVNGRDDKTRLVAWALGALAVVEISFGFAARPQIFTALGLAAELWLLQRVHRGQWGWALALPPLFALWINTHGGVVAGWVLLLAAACATTGQGLLKKFAPGVLGACIGPGLPRKTVLWLWLATVLSTLALLANPYGVELLRWLVGSVLWLRPQIVEWNPAPLDWNHAAFFFCVALAVIALGLSRRTWALWEAAVVALLAVLALRSIRNTPLFCLAALALLPPYLASVLDRFQDNFQRLAELGRKPAAQRLLTGLLVFAAAGCLLATIFLHKERAWTMEVPRKQYPVAAVEFIQQHELQGNLLVFFDWGELCLWELPGSRVSIDGRLDTCYPPGVIAAHWNFYNGKPFDSAALDLDRADFALLPSKLAGSLVLAKRFGWQAVYYDDLAVVLVKQVNQFPKLAGLKLPVQGDATATEGRAAFPNRFPVAVSSAQ